MGVYNNNKDGTRSTIANTIQVIDAPMEQFVSRDEFSAVVPSDTSVDNKLVNDDKFDTKLNDIWKAQGELGAKNLLVYPYFVKSGGYSGITFNVNDNGSVLVNGSGSYSHIYLHNASLELAVGEYELCLELANSPVSSDFKIGLDMRLTTNVESEPIKKVRVICSDDTIKSHVKFSITQEDVEAIKSGQLISTLRIYAEPKVYSQSATIDNVIAHPMIRLASDTDDTWQPYVPTNYQLNQKLDTIAGIYLPNASNTSSKKVVASTGQTSVTFDASTFMSRYNVASSDLDLHISADTASGDIVSYNNVSVTGGIVTVTFDALAEQTTFICKCSVIQ